MKKINLTHLVIFVIILIVIILAPYLIKISGFSTAVDMSFKVCFAGPSYDAGQSSSETVYADENDVFNLDVYFVDTDTTPPLSASINPNPGFTISTTADPPNRTKVTISATLTGGFVGSHTYILTVTDGICEKTFELNLIVTAAPSTGGGRGGCTVRYSCESTWGECEKANGYSLQERLCHQTCGYPDFTERKGCLPSGCYSADDCGRVAWFDCIGGECVAKECVTDDDCAPYFECVDGTCEPVGILEIEEIPIEMPGRISFLKEESVLFPTTDEIRGYYTHKINIKEMVNFFPVYNLFYEPTTTPLAAIVKESDWITKAFAAFTAFLLFLLIAYLITRERKYVPPETE